MCGFAEQLEFIDAHDSPDYAEFGGKEAVLSKMEETARAVCDFYIGQTPPDGVPYWDTGAPGLALMGDYMDRTSDPFNEFEPVDSSAAAIAAQGLLRLGRYLKSRGRAADGEKYWSAGLKVSDTIFGSPYISEDDSHQGLILHSVYHRPNGWDYIPPGSKIPRGESSMWGDYHAIELALYIHKIIKNEKYLTFQG
jgi:hypothetical protein